VADSSVAITAGSGTPIRVLTALGAGVADQQVVTLADSAGNLIGSAQGTTPGTTDGGLAPLFVRAPTTPVARTATAGNYAVGLADAEGKQIVQQYADPANTWQVALTLTTTTASAAKAAGAAGIRNYLTGLTLSNSAATATLVQVLDGATVIWQAQLAASQAAFFVAFETPLRGTAATAMNVKLGTAVTSVYASCQGFIGI
jgi:hypothetical protein